jgi:hypothetical protein
MGRRNHVVVVSLLLAGVVAPASFPAGENPRFAMPGPPTTAEATPTMEEWLRRLAGQFRYEGMANPYAREPRPVSGRSDCMQVGSGPGVQCVLDVKWPERWLGTNPMPPHPNLDPSMMLFGFEPSGDHLHFLQVDNKGIAQGGTGVLSGNMAKLMTDPPRNGGVGVSRIYAPAHGRFIQIWVSSKGTQGEGVTTLMLYMRRVAPAETGGASRPASAQPDAGG